MKRVWAPEKDCTCKLEFLCLSLADNYNGSIGDVDILDQKRNLCHSDRFARKIK